ncbi:MAG: hypothetical protein HN342_13805 [Nitrospina sp.]|nr:hypothetical protein [Nitrospina sp.]
MKIVNESFGRALLFFLIFATLFLPGFGNFGAEVSAVDCPANITLEVTQGTPDVVSGTVTNVDPDDVWVIVFVRTDKWYIQPYADERAYLTVNSDGTYETWIRNWNQISAFVIRKGYDALSGQQIYRPFPLSVDCVDVLAMAAYPTVQFSGYEWAVKAGVSLGPGPNDFSSSNDNVWVDNRGRLHLKITQRDGKWYCAEVVLMKSLGYGTYNFQVSSRVDLLNNNVVGSPFIYRDDTHELDIEFSRWGIEGGPNAQFVVQPYYNLGNREQFSMSLSNEASTHIIKWMADLVFFQSAQGHYSDPPAEQVIHGWDYTGGDIPAEADEQVHVNMWLFNGQAPSDGKETEMVIQGFTFAASECPNCSGTAVVLNNETFLSGSDCRCVGTESITIGPGLIIQDDAKVIFKAPNVKINDGFHSKRGAVVVIGENPGALPNR